MHGARDRARHRRVGPHQRPPASGAVRRWSLTLLLAALAGAIPSCGSRAAESVGGQRPEPQGSGRAGTETVAPSDGTPADGAPVWGYRVVRSFPHDPGAFTQGLDYHGGLLFESTGMYGRSSVRGVELETGRVLRRRNLPPTQFGEGVAHWQGLLYQLTWHDGLCYIYQAEGLELLYTLRYEGEGWGLTHDGERFILSDGSDTLRFLHPDSFALLGRLEVHENGRPVPNLNELEYVEGEVWANVWHSERIARIDPDSGRLVGWIDLEGIIDLRPDPPVGERQNVLNGIAYDPVGKRIFVTGKHWPRLFQIELVPPR